MRIIRFADLHQTSWKNGNGITREIAEVRIGNEIVWRLSIADVGVNGLFSKYEGLNRILTVIEGKGMELISPLQTLQANFAEPVSFDGGLEIQSRLKQGFLRDFNLIYNPRFCMCHAHVTVGHVKQFVKAGFGVIEVLHCIEGQISLGETEQLQKHDTALIDCDAIQYAVAEGSIALLITIQSVATS